MKRTAAAAFVALGSMVALPARAIEREHHLGLDAGGSLLVVNDKSTPDLGGGFGAHWTYGLNDAFNLMAEGAWSLVALHESTEGAPRTRPSWVANADVGLGYVFDVLRWVPYGGVLVGGYALSGGSIDRVKMLAGASLALGLDYRFSRSVAAGVAFRQHMLTEPSTYPSFTQVFARVEYTWGW
jgi:hypothetical protein